MASKKLGKEDREFQLMQDWWKLFQEFYEVENTDEYGKAHFNALNELSEKYKDVTLTKYLVFAQAHWWDDVWVEKFGKDKGVNE